MTAIAAVISPGLWKAYGIPGAAFGYLLLMLLMTAGFFFVKDSHIDRKTLTDPECATEIRKGYCLRVAFSELKMPYDTVVVTDFADLGCEASAKSVAVCATLNSNQKSVDRVQCVVMRALELETAGCEV